MLITYLIVPLIRTQILHMCKRNVYHHILFIALWFMDSLASIKNQKPNETKKAKDLCVFPIPYANFRNETCVPSFPSAGAHMCVYVLNQLSNRANHPYIELIYLPDLQRSIGSRVCVWVECLPGA